MIDRSGNIIVKKAIMHKCYQVIKENTAQVAIIIPIAAAICAVASDYYVYLINWGYYKYFNINERLMLPYNKRNLFQYISQLVIFGIYWAFSIIAVRIFSLKGNYIKKIIFLIVIPLIISVNMAYDGEFNLILVIVSIILLPFHWIMIFSLGYCMQVSLHQEILSKSNRKEQKKKTQKKKVGKKWGDKEYRVLGIALILGGCILEWLLF